MHAMTENGQSRAVQSPIVGMWAVCLSGPRKSCWQSCFRTEGPLLLRWCLFSFYFLSGSPVIWELILRNPNCRFSKRYWFDSSYPKRFACTSITICRRKQLKTWMNGKTHWSGLFRQHQMHLLWVTVPASKLRLSSLSMGLQSKVGHLMNLLETLATGLIISVLNVHYYFCG